ncbi:probable G-protein coupled receptor 156 [Chanos chanos]|uniref:Probable G-protein coupled receptor 156 n=1 Tax=Chanos chanos TaxID=29144 RepID=A0A6J2WGQ3_CHACN|nr:probable G-protein coupled receptor 156 [Chanos chanos]
METRLNCSSLCESGVCTIHIGVSNQHGWDMIQRICAVSTGTVDVKGRSLSTVLCAIVWTLLSCGILLALFFLLFTLRFRNNRIVKMSSPNLNILTLCGSVLTYSTGFLFAMEERTALQVHTRAKRTVLFCMSVRMSQAWIWTLCIGSSLVFGPILGKTWRLYRVFTQRVPDKRVIIRDIQLMGLVSLLILVDLAILTTWRLTDPVKCARSVTAVSKVVEWDVSYSLSQLDSCSSFYSDLWAVLFSVLKGSLLLYGTYLAGLTSNVSLPPVNQSLTIMGAVCLVTLSTAVVVPVSRYLYAWPNVVYGVVSGAIFICTSAINCLLFVPQLTQWRQFEEEINSTHSQMAKYFSSPSKSLHSMYSEDEIYYLLGENDSMKRLINEKNAVIDSLQEQVNNAKDKLVKLMSVTQPQEEQEMDSSITNLHSSSTQMTVVLPESPPTLNQQGDSEMSPPVVLNPPPYIPPPPPPSDSPLTTSHETPPARLLISNGAPASPVSVPAPSQSPRTPDGASQSSQTMPWKSECVSDKLSFRDCTDVSKFHITLDSTTIQPERDCQVSNEEAPPASPVDQYNLLQASPLVSPTWPCSTQADIPGSAGQFVLSPALTKGSQKRLVSSEQLQEILQDLSVNAVGSSVRSPILMRTTSSTSPTKEDVPSLSPRSPFHFYYPSISPYVMRKRRPPFHSSRGGTLTYFYPGPPPAGQRTGSVPPDPERPKEPGDSGPPETAVDIGTHRQHLDSWNHESDEEEEEEEEEYVASRRFKRGSRWRHRAPPSRRCSATPSLGQKVKPVAGGQWERCGQTVELEPSSDVRGYSDSESSSSEDYCYYHRPYCEACLQGPYTDSSTSETSDSEFGGICRASHPVVFKEDLKPTFV